MFYQRVCKDEEPPWNLTRGELVLMDSWVAEPDLGQSFQSSDGRVMSLLLVPMETLMLRPNPV